MKLDKINKEKNVSYIENQAGLWIQDNKKWYLRLRAIDRLMGSYTYYESKTGKEQGLWKTIKLNWRYYQIKKQMTVRENKEAEEEMASWVRKNAPD